MPPEDDTHHLGVLTLAWAGEINERTVSLRRDVDDIRKEMAEGLKAVREEIQSLRGQIWYIAVAALVGPTLAVLLGRLLG